MNKRNYLIGGIGYILIFFLFANNVGERKQLHWEDPNDFLAYSIPKISTTDYPQCAVIFLEPFLNGVSQPAKTQPFQGIIHAEGLLANLIERVSFLHFFSGLLAITPSLGIREIIFPFHFFW